MNNPEEIKMGFDAAGFNPNVNNQTPGIKANPGIKADKVNQPDGKQQIAEVGNTNALDFTKSTIDIKFTGKPASKGLDNVNFFASNDSVGKATLKTAADGLDIGNGRLFEAAKAVLQDLRSIA